ncbi:MAG: hypothetical protein HWE22_04905 [Flavobacteriales bacterium]|nr:hypothetical protein [Flavobacteriales bacterium]
MFRLLLFLSISLFFLSCKEVYTKGDELFYQISEADSTRCMDEILDGIWEEGQNNLYKLDIIYNSDIAYCGIIDVFRVMMNSQGQVMVNTNIDSSNVTAKVVDYFMFNRNKASNMDYQYASYFSLNASELAEQLLWAEERVKKLQGKESVDTFDLRIAQDYLETVKSWTQTRELIDEKLFVQSSTAHIRFSYLVKGEKWQSIKRKIELAYYQMRNYECMRYFGETYLHLFERTQRKGRDLDKQKLEALKTMHPAIIIDNDWSKRDK